MKEITLAGMVLVHSGEDWPHARPPCCKASGNLFFVVCLGFRLFLIEFRQEMTSHLEHNEKIVSWMQPVHGGVEDQFPVLRMKGAFYKLSLRMMKSIWRHVRLKRGFVNVERAPYGGLKLKIPTLLLTEKMRTQTRFNVRPSYFFSFFVWFAGFVLFNNDAGR
jgi:hypothetical protein